MSRSRAVLIILLAALVDAVAVIAASGTISITSLPPWPLGIGLHLAVVATCSLVAMRFSPQAEGARIAGSGTLACLTFVFTLLAPIAGPLAIAAILTAFRPLTELGRSASPVIIGNPLQPRTGPAPLEPLALSLAKNDSQALRHAGPFLYRDRSPEAVAVLRQLQTHHDPRTQLQAQAALAALAETADQQLDRLRRDTTAQPSARLELASLLHTMATSRLHDESESDALLHEATDHLEAVLQATPDDVESLHLFGRCLIESRRYENVPALIGVLETLQGGKTPADQLKVDLYAGNGRWHEAAEVARRQGMKMATATRRFWFSASSGPSSASNQATAS